MSPTRTAPELITTLKTGWNDALQQWWDQSQAALDPWKQAWDTMAPGVSGQTLGMPSRRHRAHASGSPCGCDSDRDCQCGDNHRRENGHHGEDEHKHAHEPVDDHGHGYSHTRCDCESPCHCCIPDADVVLHARAGEQRVVPFLLRNPWRRERAVTVAVGPWQVCDGDRLEVQSEVDAGESLTLQPCENRVVRLRVMVQGICDDAKNTKDDTKDDTKGIPTNEGRFGCDVESCASAYADVRFEGCARPQRIAVVVHPASCNAVELPCDCGCCR